MCMAVCLQLVGTLFSGKRPPKMICSFAIKAAINKNSSTDHYFTSFRQNKKAQGFGVPRISGAPTTKGLLSITTK